MKLPGVPVSFIGIVFILFLRGPGYFSITPRFVVFVSKIVDDTPRQNRECSAYTFLYFFLISRYFLYNFFFLNSPIPACVPVHEKPENIPRNTIGYLVHTLVPASSLHHRALDKYLLRTYLVVQMAGPARRCFR